MLALFKYNCICNASRDIQWVKRLASYGGKGKHLEGLVGVECPVKQFGSLNLIGVCSEDVCLGPGLLWTGRLVCLWGLYIMMHVSNQDIAI